MVVEGAAYDHHDFSREVRYEYANLDMPALWFRWFPVNANDCLLLVRVCKNPKISETRPELENRGISGFG